MVVYAMADESRLLEMVEALEREDAPPVGMDFDPYEDHEFDPRGEGEDDIEPQPGDAEYLEAGEVEHD